MDKDLTGREFGIGICQRNDELYTARVTDSSGKRRQKYLEQYRNASKPLQMILVHSKMALLEFICPSNG